MRPQLESDIADSRETPDPVPAKPAAPVPFPGAPASSIVGHINLIHQELALLRRMGQSNSRRISEMSAVVGAAVALVLQLADRLDPGLKGGEPEDLTTE